MKVDLLIHGTLSQGQSFWNTLDQNYCTQFYVTRDENLVMECEIRKSENGTFVAYYNYLRYNNVNSMSRPGSYFGMTVRMEDGVCCDVRTMFHVLDNLFFKHIVGSLLRESDGKFIYNVDSFESQNEFLNKIQKNLINMLQSDFVGSDFKTVPLHYVQGNMVQRLNVEDVTPSLATDILLKGIKLIISPQFPTREVQLLRAKVDEAVKDTNNKIAHIQKQNSQIISEKDRDINGLKNAMISERDQHRRETEALNQKLREHQRSVQDLNQKLSLNQNGAQISKIANELKNPVQHLSELLSAISPGNTTPKVKEPKEKSPLPIGKKVKYALLSLGILLLLFFIGYFIGAQNNKNIKAIEHHHYEKVVDTVYINRPVLPIPSVHENLSDYFKINIPELITSPFELKKGLRYTFEIKNKENGKRPIPNGIWYFNDIQSGNGQKCKYTPISVGELNIKFTCSDSSTITRTIKVNP